MRKFFDFGVKSVLLVTVSAFGFVVLYFLFGVFSEVGTRALIRVYANFPETPSTRYTTFSNISGAIVALFGVAAALFTFILNARLTRRAQRKQHTITILLETRLSEYFQATISRRRAVFPEFTDITFEMWDNARNAQPANSTPTAKDDAQQQRDGAAALTQLLNYYEFLAVGVREGDLDKDMLHKTIRGIMCNLVDDARLLISEMRRQSPKTYEHLAPLYDDWRIPGAKDINGNPNERPIPD